MSTQSVRALILYRVAIEGLVSTRQPISGVIVENLKNHAGQVFWSRAKMFEGFVL